MSSGSSGVVNRDKSRLSRPFSASNCATRRASVCPACRTVSIDAADSVGVVGSFVIGLLRILPRFRGGVCQPSVVSSLEFVAFYHYNAGTMRVDHGKGERISRNITKLRFSLVPFRVIRRRAREVLRVSAGRGCVPSASRRLFARTSERYSRRFHPEAAAG